MDDLKKDMFGFIQVDCSMIAYQPTFVFFEKKQLKNIGASDDEGNSSYAGICVSRC